MNRIYTSYLDSNYKKLNDLTIRGYEGNAKAYDFLYKGILPKDKKARILDVGCGTGYFLYYLNKKGYTNYFGIDISKQQIEFCRKNITGKVKTIDAFKFLRDKKNEFDVIIMNDLLEHMPKNRLINFLDLIYISLRNNGAAIIKVPNMSNPFGLRSRYIDMTHEVGFTENSLREVLEVIGFQIIQIKGASYPILSFKSAIGKVGEMIIYKFIKLLFMIQGYSVPKFLNKNIVAIAMKK